MRFVRKALLVVTSWFLIGPSWSLAAQDAQAAPIPPQLVSGRKVFVSNGGADESSPYVFTKGAIPAQPYNLLYAAMKTWNRYEIVPTPAEADLVFEVRVTNAREGNGVIVTIFDAKTHFKLWTITEVIGAAARFKTYDKNVAKAVDQAVQDLKAIVGSTPN